MSTFENLHKSIELGGGPISLKNRIIMSPLTRNRAVPTNVPNDEMLEYYEQRAAGGAGLIIAEGTLITPQGTEWQNAPGIWNQQQVIAWKKITDAVHKHGSKIICQLWHLGRVSHPNAPEQIASGEPVYAPSAIAARGGKFRFIEGEPGYVTPTAVPDPRVLVELFKQAAINAKAAGFDGVELHGAHGYLVHEFLDSSSNARSDAYGGSVENRCRFGLEVLDELVKIWGNGRVAIKLGPCGGGNDMGMPLDETVATFTHFIKEIESRFHLAYFCMMRYSRKLDNLFDGKLRATQHDVLATYRHLVTKASFIFNADLTPSEAESLIASGMIDAAAFGWLWISNPDLAKRLEQGVDLNESVDVSLLYPGVGVSIRRGYTDYPFATQVNM